MREGEKNDRKEKQGCTGRRKAWHQRKRNCVVKEMEGCYRLRREASHSVLGERGFWKMKGNIREAMSKVLRLVQRLWHIEIVA